MRITPLQTVSAAGQTAQVGASLPNASIKGPGELDLFGQVMATKPQFTGPIRPRLDLEHITIDPQVVQMLRNDGPQKVELTLSQQLAAGWERYFLWETLIAIGFAAIPVASQYRYSAMFDHPSPSGSISSPCADSGTPYPFTHSS